MTIAEWVEERSTSVPSSLRADIVAALGPDARRNVSETSRACLAAASRVLLELLRDRAFGRDSAGRLLAADALATFAFEHAAESRMSGVKLAALAADAAGQLGSSTTRA